MATCTPLDEIRINRSLWTVPSAERALDGWLEGKPSEEQTRVAIATALAARASWKPSKQGLELVAQLKALIGWRIQIQFWDPIMSILEDEGPFPLDGDCTDVLLLQSGDFLQAYIALKNAQEVPNADGYSPLRCLRSVDGVAHRLAPLSAIYAIWPLEKS